jgi:hypothetical protein
LSVKLNPIPPILVNTELAFLLILQEVMGGQKIFDFIFQLIYAEAHLVSVNKNLLFKLSEKP